MKLYNHVSKFAAYRLLPKKEHPGMRWAMSLQPGDIIHTCSSWPFNTRVSLTRKPWIEVETRTWSCYGDRRMFGGPRTKAHRHPHSVNGYVVTGVTVHDIDGRCHSYPGGGCVGRQLTPAEIREIIKQRGSSVSEVRDVAEKFVTDWWTTDRHTDTERRDFIATYIRDWERAMDPNTPVCDSNGFRLTV